MKNEFVPYDIALAMKKLGFDEPCFGFYYLDEPIELFQNCKWDKRTNSYWNTKISEGDNEYTVAPLYQQAFRWFREKYDLDGETCRYNLSHSEAKFLGIDITKTKHRYLVVINGEDFPNLEDMTLFISREEAELACLRKLIEIVKGKQR
jgi:hypothetical protein